MENENLTTDNNQKLSALNITPLLNRSAVKKFALDLSKANRAGRFNRVSLEFLERINARLKNIIREEVQRHPSLGKTLK
jgi:hypothetical protein